MISPVLLIVVIAVIAITAKKWKASPSNGSLAFTAESLATVDGSSLHDKLDEWVVAGLIDSGQAVALEQYEGDSAPVAPNRGPLVFEAMGYLGGGLVFAAVALVIGNRWESYSTAARIVALALPTLVAVMAGWWIGKSDELPMQRLGSALWLLAVAGSAAVAAVVWVDAIHGGDRADHGLALFIGAAALVVAATAWWLRRLELQLLALLGAVVTAWLGLVDSVARLSDSSMSARDAGIALLVLGTGWLAAGLFGRLTPTLLANLLGSAVILVSTQIIYSATEHVGLWVGLAAAVALMAVGVARSEIVVLLIGTLGLFQWTPQLALFYLEDTIGAEATLFVIGTLVIVLAGSMTRLIPWVKARHTRSELAA